MDPDGVVLVVLRSAGVRVRRVRLAEGHAAAELAGVRLDEVVRDLEVARERVRVDGAALRRGRHVPADT